MKTLKTLSLDLRERIVACCDAGVETQARIAARFMVSLGMVKKLLLQRRRTGSVENRRFLCGRKPVLLESQRQAMAELLAKEPDLTLAALKERLGLECTLATVHNALGDIGLKYKKRRCAPVSRTGRTSPGHGLSGRSGSRI
ncbi:MAG: transcriptional regulator [Verrucomicrobiales bacterium]|nr:transcriptional regulator [Verrucomicrobiales bacterium]